MGISDIVSIIACVISVIASIISIFAAAKVVKTKQEIRARDISNTKITMVGRDHKN